MAQQPDEICEPPAAAQQPAPRRWSSTRFGVIGGSIGGLLGGLVGGGAGGPIGSHMRGPVAIIDMAPGSEVALGVLTGALFGAVGGALIGAPGAWLVGKVSGRRTTLVAMLCSAFGAAAVAPIEASHQGALIASIGFALGMSALTLLSVALIGAVRALYRWRLLRWLAAAWLALCLGGAIYSSTLPTPGFTPSSARPTEPVVQLRCASLPPPLTVIAVHAWFAAYDPADGSWRRWEVWQFKENDDKSWGHVRKDFMHIDAGVGGGPYQILEEWRGDQARALLTALESATTRYERRDRYIAWPGPNSNTYPVWVLNEANVSCALHPLALGQHYNGVLGLTTSGSGVQIETAAMGGRFGLREGAEVHLLTMPFGVDILAPAITTPLGRWGFPK